MRQTVGLGFSVHTGWAIGVIVEGRQVLARARVELFSEPMRFIYHASVEKPAEAASMIAEVERLARKNAKPAVRALIAEWKPIVGLAAPKPLPALESILKSHPLLHTAEGQLYRNALEAACRGLGLDVVSAKPVDPLPDFGELGRPWSKDHRLAAALALGALKRAA